MKITKFDPNYPWKLGDTTLAQGGGVSVSTGDSGSTGGSSGAAGGDLAGTLPDPTVVGIQGTPVDALPASATEYLDGTGHWSTPPGSGTGYVTNVGGGKEVINTIAASGASHTLDLSLGNVQDLTLTASCTLTFSGATAGVFCSFELFLRQDGTGGWATTWPGSVVWPGGSAPTLDTTPSNLTVLAFGSEDGGTTWYGFPSHGSGSGSLEVKEVDGSPDVTGVTIIRVSNGTLTNDGGGQVTIVTGGGGGSSGILWPSQDPLPTAPSAYDDDWSALSGWTTIGSLPTLNVTDRPNLLHMANASPGTSNLMGIVKTAPTPPYVVATTGVFKLSSGSLDYGILLAETSGKFMIFGPATYGGASWARSLWADATTRTNFNADAAPPPAVPVYIRVVVTSATSVQSFFSSDDNGHPGGGYIWTPASAAFDPGFTIGRVGLGMTIHDTSIAEEAFWGPIRFAVGTAGQTWNGYAWV